MGGDFVDFDEDIVDGFGRFLATDDKEEIFDGSELLDLEAPLGLGDGAVWAPVKPVLRRLFREIVPAMLCLQYNEIRALMINGPVNNK